MKYFHVVNVCMILFSCLLLQTAEAHKVNIFAYVQDGKIYAEGYFVDGSKCKNSVIEIVDVKTGEKLLEGKTDDDGRASLDIPRQASLKLILRAGEGHQNEYIISGEEIRGAIPGARKQAEKVRERRAVEQTVQRAVKSEQLPKAPTALHPPVSSEEIEAAVGKIVDSKLQPVMKILLELQEESGKPGLTEILGGIGYILGILGIIAYFKGRGTNR